MAESQSQNDPGAGGGDWFGANAPPNYQNDYWAQDRPQVLAQNGLKDTSGKVWNGSTWVAGPTGGGAAAGATNADPNAFRDAWYASGGKTVTDLKNFVTAHPEFGATITGSKGSKVMIGGQAFQAVRSAGIGGGIGAAWDPLGAEGSDGGGMQLGDFGSLAQGFTDKFKAPSVEEMRATPGYQFALTQGIDALDKRAAANGTVNGGGEKRNILEFATGLADQTGQQRYQNALNEYKQQYDIFRNNGNDIFNRFNTLADRGTSAANAATS